MALNKHLIWRRDILSLLAIALVWSGPITGPYQNAWSQSDTQQLKLNGIFFRPDGRSAALFSIAPTQQKLVMEGHVISNGLLLNKVEARGVEIVDGEERKWLFLETADLAESPPNDEKIPEARQQQANADAPEITTYRRRIIRLKAAFSEVQRNGNRAGLVLRDDSVLDLLPGPKLQKGDIIVKANGTSFLSGEDIEDFAYDWSTDRSFSYTIIRDGKEMTLR